MPEWHVEKILEETPLLRTFSRKTRMSGIALIWIEKETDEWIQSAAGPL